MLNEMTAYKAWFSSGEVKLALEFKAETSYAVCEVAEELAKKLGLEFTWDVEENKNAE